jgi:sec-independent protein translocase protein TatA
LIKHSDETGSPSRADGSDPRGSPDGALVGKLGMHDRNSFSPIDQISGRARAQITLLGKGAIRMGEGLFQPMHLLVIFLIALVVFGPKNLPELGKGLGEAIRGFKNSLKGEEVTPAVTVETPVPKDSKAPNDPSGQP